MNKGQSLTLEQMFFFGIGVVILISVFFSYSAIKSQVNELSTEDQIKEVGELILSGISKVAKELENNDKYSIIVSPPERIAKNNYIVDIVNNQLVVDLLNVNKTIELSLESINETFTVDGTVFSSINPIIIEGDGTKSLITIRRYER